MGSPEVISAITSHLEEFFSLYEKDLISRGKWGELNFETNENDFNQLSSLLKQLKQYPIDQLPDAVANQLNQYLQQLVQFSQQIDAFQINTPNAQQTRNNLSSQVHSVTEQIVGLMAQWLPFLAMQSGQEDIHSNILKKAEEDQRAIENILNQLKDAAPKGTIAAAEAGARIHSSAFEDEEEELHTQARQWLVSTSILAFVTALIATVFWNADLLWSAYFGLPLEKTDIPSVLRSVGNKAFIIVIFGTGTIWCGRIYKSLKHQAAIYKQKAIAINTFESFFAAAANQQTKDAVLLETTRAIFSEHRTGYLEAGQQSPDVASQITKIIQRDQGT